MSASADTRRSDAIYLAKIDGEPFIGTLAELAKKDARRLVAVNLTHVLADMRKRAKSEGVDMSGFWADLRRR